MKHAVIGILAHVDAGKTTLSEDLLFRTGAIRKKGSVDSGDTVMDSNAIEADRGITIAYNGEVHGDTIDLVDRYPGPCGLLRRGRARPVGTRLRYSRSVRLRRRTEPYKDPLGPFATTSYPDIYFRE